MIPIFLPSITFGFGKVWSRWDTLSSQLCEFLHCLALKQPSRADVFCAVELYTALQERLVENHLPNVELSRQGRMLPSISKLLLPIYPDLRDNEKVVADLKKPDCVTSEVFFWNCPHEEEPWRNFFSARFVIPVRISPVEWGYYNSPFFKGLDCPFCSLHETDFTSKAKLPGPSQRTPAHSIILRVKEPAASPKVLKKGMCHFKKMVCKRTPLGSIFKKVPPNPRFRI